MKPFFWKRLFVGLGRWRRFDAMQKSLLLNAVSRVALARVGLWALPLARVRGLVAGVKGRARPDLAPERFVWAVEIASRFVPCATCLVRAVALQGLLRHSGHRSQLLVGVALGEDGTLSSHAWVECEGRIILGQTPLARYEPLLVIDSHPGQVGADGTQPAQETPQRPDVLRGDASQQAGR